MFPPSLGGGGQIHRMSLLLTVLVGAAGVPIRPSTSSENHGAVVRRQLEASSVSVEIDSGATVHANKQNIDADKSISPEAKERLGLSPDYAAPPRDVLLQQRAAILHELPGTEEAESTVPPSLVQSGVHEELQSKRPSSQTITAIADTHESIEDWRKAALAQDGSLNMQLLLPTPQALEKIRPKWASAGLAQEDMLASFDKEMSRLGADASEERAALEEHQVRSASPPRPDAAYNVEKADAHEGGKKAKPKPPSQDPMAFRFYRFTPLKVRSIKHATGVSIGEFYLWTFGQQLELNKYAAAANELGRNPPGEDAMMVRDGNIASKWTDMNMGSIVIILPWPVVATNFAFSTSRDHPERDPLQWYLEGSKDMKHWTMLMGQLSDAPVFAPRKRQTDVFSWKVDCLVGDWSEWAECSEKCSGGNQTRVRAIERHSWNDGQCQTKFSQMQHCNEEPCQADTIVKANAIRGSIGSAIMIAMLSVWLVLIF